MSAGSRAGLDARPPGGAGAVLLAWTLLASALLASALPHLEDSGLYYDEAFLAQQARDFVEPGREALHPGSARHVYLFGRPFPTRNAAYLGSLKSQLLIPSFALFGPSVPVLRLSTLAVGLLGLLFSMLWTRRLFGAACAVLAGVLIACDASFYFFSQFEWGPFTTGLLCRSLGLFAVVRGWQERQAAWLAVGGLAFGLGVYSRADFAVILAAMAAALLLFHRDRVREALHERLRSTLGAAAAFGLAALPMLLSARALLEASASIAERGGAGYRADLLWSVLDGSHFHRLMQVGGRFEAIFETPGAAGLFGYACIVAAGLVGFDLAVKRPERAPGDARPFLLASALGVPLLTWLLPGAVRAHHALNALPFLHVLVALAAVSLWRRDFRQPVVRALVRGATAASLAALLVSNAVVIRQTQAFVDSTGGRGRFSTALDELAAELDEQPDAMLVSLDWGFHEPLLFLTREPRAIEAIWSIPRELRRGRPWSHEGDEGHLYLLHQDPYDLFGLGPAFLSAVQRLEPERAKIRHHRDRAGELVFTSVRLLAPHRVLYGGEFQIHFGDFQIQLD